MIKTVNVNPLVPIFTTRPGILSPVKGIKLSTGDILACIHAGGLVHEVLENGELLSLNQKNYNLDNNKKIREEKEAAKIEADRVAEEQKAEKIKADELAKEEEAKIAESNRKAAEDAAKIAKSAQNNQSNKNQEHKK